MPEVTIEQAFQTALTHHQAGRLADAEPLYRSILAAQPSHAGALHYLGVLAHQMGRNDVAVELIHKAIAMMPSASIFHSNLGEIYKKTGRLDEAIVAFRRAIHLKPDSAEALNNLGSALLEQGHFADAATVCRQAVELKPDYAKAYNNLGNALMQQGCPDGAITAWLRALELKPDLAETHCNLGIALMGQGRLSDAEAAYRRAIRLRQDYGEAYCNLGAALLEQGRATDAADACRRAIELKPDYADAHSNLGNALRQQGSLDEAITAYRRALQLNADLAGTHYNLGIALMDQGRLADAETAYRRAIELRPVFAKAQFGRSFLHLLRGEFEQGWLLHETRWDVDDIQPTNRNFPQPLWNGEPLNGRRILVHAEQGFGDTLQFIRYAPLVAQRGGHVIVECQPGLEALLRGMEGMVEVITGGGPLPHFDLHCPMMSLPLAFGTRVDTIPSTIPYLRADMLKIAQWRERLDRQSENNRSDHRPVLKVGLVWAGGVRPHQPSANWINQRRSISLNQFAPLAGVPGVVFVSLQKGEPAKEARTPPEGMELLDWTDELHDFADTAALVEGLDLVISVDTAVAHLAGALGKPVWLLNRFDTCWRWMLEREDSPWYPTMRIFRQPKAGDWPPVIERVVEELSALFAQHR